MSILVNGRQIEVILQQNNGNPASPGTELDVSNYLLSLGNISWSVDENLTKLSIGNLSISLTDDTSNTVWTFINTGLTSTSGLLPPWLILNVDGVQRFIGLIKETPVRTQDIGTLEIAINAVDWSSMLETKRIKPDDMAFKRSFKAGIAYAAGTSVTAKSVYNKELRRGHDRNLVAVPTSEAANFSVGDSVYFANYDGWTDYNRTYLIISTLTMDVGGLGTMYCLWLNSPFQWNERSANPANFGQTSTISRQYKTTSDPVKNPTDLPLFICQEDFTVSTAGKTAKTSIILNYVDGLLPGDTLDKLDNISNPGTFSVNVVDVDTVSNTVYLDAAINNDLVSGITSFQLNATSMTDCVLFPLTTLVETSIAGLAYPVDYTSYSPITLPSPCFSFISPDSKLQNLHTESLSGVSDIQPSLTNFQVKGTAGLAWSGLPSSGWDTLGGYTKYVCWTNQKTTAPSYLMPYATLPANADPQTSETRGYVRFPGLDGSKSSRSADPSKGTSATPVYKWVYDYSNNRVYRFQTVGVNLTLDVQTWNGSIWSSVTGFSLTGVGSPIDVVPFMDTLSSVGSGYGLLALYKDGTVKNILSTMSYSGIALAGKDVLHPTTKALQTHIIQTTNGVYYVTPSGYGRIWVTGGVLKSKWVQLMDLSNQKDLIQSITPLTNTFLFSNNRIITLAKVSYKTSINDERYIDDTYLLQLNKDIQDVPKDSVYSVDFIVKNIPRTTMAIKSPVSQDVFGFMGGRLFQITNYLPETVERFSPINQTASALIEFVCAMSNTVAQPLVTGAIKLITRGFNKAVQNITIDQVSMKESRWNQHLASCVVIKGADEKKGVAVSTTQLAGLTISYSNDVYIRNSSQATSIAQSYLAFFEKPRRQVEQVWFSQSFPAPWETLSPMDVITINGGSTQYYLISLNHNLVDQTATVQLLEVV